MRTAAKIVEAVIIVLIGMALGLGAAAGIEKLGSWLSRLHG